MTTPDPFISSRKDDHVLLARQFYGMAPLNTHEEIDAMEFVHNALPETRVSDVNISTSLVGMQMPRPFFINAMTGGTQKADEINRRLARVAQATGTPLALGSMSIAVKNLATRAAYGRLREDFPDVQFIANIGAEHTVDAAQFVVDLIGASALQIHLNAAQEIVMPEGEKDFRGWERMIRQCSDELNVPIIVKEVGFGISYDVAERIADYVDAIDVAGRGGTNFIQIENARTENHPYSFLENWGITTIRSLMDTMAAVADANKKPMVIASGGVRHPLDIVKYLALGADAVGLSAAFLQSITSSEDADEAVRKTIELVQMWDTQCAQIMALIGVPVVEELPFEADFSLPDSLMQYMAMRSSM
ncbi:type 2 isopentenyl-diphosphate Delta-isomerase [Alloscardovia sp. HMSC034E08]|uniref:type 2 isopentenyl-diphosphate Delta-isomerase n=1 Tax=Alloscardovia sp. HMSC034E08 TaxID=1739413 RepID=UPI0008BD8A98|nr:type 2 isopentenyl-diphosphate Delta-isomerase [Alloscardovia sp. HMSC034E08]OFQ99342.1 hypothetical protein HMPREF2909_07220 [Alloscardovia sp. HMSC034E08]